MELSGLDYNISVALMGLSFAISLHKAKTPVLLQKKVLTTTRWTRYQDRLDIVKGRLRWRYSN